VANEVGQRCVLMSLDALEVGRAQLHGNHHRSLAFLPTLFPSRPCPQVHACHGADILDALVAIWDACSDGADAEAALVSQLLAGMATALFWGPPALAINPRLQAAVAKCLEILPQVGGFCTTGGWMGMGRVDAPWGAAC